MNHPDFTTLEALPGHPEYRMVNGCWMDREQYDTEQWHVDSTYVNQTTGEIMVYWRATLEGLNRYSALRTQRRADRKASWAARNEADDEFSRYIEALDDAKPTR